MALRRGPFLDGFRRPASWELEDWMERKRSELDTLLAETALQVGEAWTEGGSPLQAAALLAEVAAALPGRDDLVLARVRALAEAGRLPEAEGVLAGLEPDPEDEDREEVAELLAQAWREQELQELVAPPPVQVETTDVGGPGAPPSAVRTEPRHRRWRHPLWLAAASVAALPLLLGRVPGMNGVPAPVPPAEIWFCAPRETESTHRMNQDGGAKQSLGVHGCPVVPVNGGSRLAAMQGRDGRWLVVSGEHPMENGPDPVSKPPGSSGGPGAWNLYLVELETGGVEQLTDHPARDFDARFSPDGARVVFASERTGGGDIYVIEMADRSLRRVTSHPATRRWTPPSTATRWCSSGGAGTAGPANSRTSSSCR